MSFGYRTVLLVSVFLDYPIPFTENSCVFIFIVPFEEDEKDPSVWFLDHNFVESMRDMFKKINAREKLIGWYHSGPKLRASDLEINELFKRYTPNPLLVIVDVQPKEVGVPTDAYFAVDEIKDVSAPCVMVSRICPTAGLWLT